MDSNDLEKSADHHPRQVHERGVGA
jgi:hypothetical protein